MAVKQLFGKCKLNIRKIVFTRKEVQAWDGLSRQAVEAPSLEVVESWLDEAMADLSQGWQGSRVEQEAEQSLPANSSVIRDIGREKLSAKTLILILSLGQN